MKLASQTAAFFVLNVQKLRREFLQLQSSQFHYAPSLVQLRHPLTQFLVQRLEAFLCLSSLCQVLSDLGKTRQRAFCRAQRRDNDRGPEARAILPDAPTLVVEAAFFFS